MFASIPERILLLIVAFLHHHRAPLFCVTDLAQARYVWSFFRIIHIHPHTHT